VESGHAVDRRAASTKPKRGVMAREPFDRDSLRVNPTQLRRSAKNKWRRHHVQFPWTWIECLKAAKRISTYRLALLLVYEHWRTGGKPIVLSNIIAKEEGLSRRGKWRALAELEQLGLVTVQRQRRQAPRLILRHWKEQP